MLCTSGCVRTLSQFALVSYIPDPLAAFLDELRLDLTPDCNPRAHVTVLPPRPLSKEADLRELTNLLTEEGKIALPFEVALDDIQVFPGTKVIYVGVSRGQKELHALHAALNQGELRYVCPYPFHPHITIAQDFEPARVDELAERARERWSHFDGPRRFSVECLSFVQNVAPGMWVDVAKIPLAQPVGALR